MKWTPEQDSYVIENAHQGAEQVAKDMQTLFDVKRSPEAVERHGLRIGASFSRWEVCPQCGQTVHKLKSSGVCEACHWRNLAGEKRRAREDLEKIVIAKREYDREQKAFRRYVVSLNMSAKMSEALVS